MEGKDIKVKLGTTKKEHIDAALKKIKGLHDTFKKDLKEARHEVMQTQKKLEKILPQDQIKILEKDLNKLTTDAEESAKKVIANKEKEVKAT
jgi:ribosome recycling factor